MKEQLINAPVYFIAIVLVLGTLTQMEHNYLVREQIEKIHNAQILQMKESRKFEARMVERTNDLSLRIAKLEVKTNLWKIPLRKDTDTGKTYIDQRRN